MDYLTFISAVIASLAWPVVALITLSTLKAYLPSISNRLRKLRYMDVEVEFSEAIEEIVTEAKALFPGLDTKHTPTDPVEIATEEQLKSLAKISPRAAVMEAWNRVEAVSHKAYALGPRRWNDGYQFQTTEEEFVERGVLSKPQAAVYRELKLLKNSVQMAIATNIDAESLDTYIRTAGALAAHLDMFVKTHPKTLNLAKSK